MGKLILGLGLALLAVLCLSCPASAGGAESCLVMERSESHRVQPNAGEYIVYDVPYTSYREAIITVTFGDGMNRSRLYSISLKDPEGKPHILWYAPHRDYRTTYNKARFIVTDYVDYIDVRILNPASGKWVLELPRHRGIILDVSFSLWQDIKLALVPIGKLEDGQEIRFDAWLEHNDGTRIDPAVDPRLYADTIVEVDLTDTEGRVKRIPLTMHDDMYRSGVSDAAYLEAPGEHIAVAKASGSVTIPDATTRFEAANKSLQMRMSTAGTKEDGHLLHVEVWLEESDQGMYKHVDSSVYESLSAVQLIVEAGGQAIPYDMVWNGTRYVASIPLTEAGTLRLSAVGNTSLPRELHTVQEKLDVAPRSYRIRFEVVGAQNAGELVNLHAWLETAYAGNYARVTDPSVYAGVTGAELTVTNTSGDSVSYSMTQDKDGFSASNVALDTQDTLQLRVEATHATHMIYSRESVLEVGPKVPALELELSGGFEDGQIMVCTAWLEEPTRGVYERVDDMSLYLDQEATVMLRIVNAQNESFEFPMERKGDSFVCNVSLTAQGKTQVSAFVVNTRSKIHPAATVVDIARKSYRLYLAHTPNPEDGHMMTWTAWFEAATGGIYQRVTADDIYVVAADGVELTITEEGGNPVPYQMERVGREFVVDTPLSRAGSLTANVTASASGETFHPTRRSVAVAKKAYQLQLEPIGVLEHGQIASFRAWISEPEAGIFKHYGNQRLYNATKVILRLSMDGMDDFVREMEPDGVYYRLNDIPMNAEGLLRATATAETTVETIRPIQNEFPIASKTYRIGLQADGRMVATKPVIITAWLEEADEGVYAATADEKLIFTTDLQLWLDVDGVEKGPFSMEHNEATNQYQYTWTGVAAQHGTLLTKIRAVNPDERRVFVPESGEYAIGPFIALSEIELRTAYDVKTQQVTVSVGLLPEELNEEGFCGEFILYDAQGNLLETGEWRGTEHTFAVKLPPQAGRAVYPVVLSLTGEDGRIVTGNTQYTIPNAWQRLPLDIQAAIIAGLAILLFTAWCIFRSWSRRNPHMVGALYLEIYDEQHGFTPGYNPMKYALKRYRRVKLAKLTKDVRFGNILIRFKSDADLSQLLLKNVAYNAENDYFVIRKGSSGVTLQDAQRLKLIVQDPSVDFDQLLADQGPNPRVPVMVTCILTYLQEDYQEEEA